MRMVPPRSAVRTSREKALATPATDMPRPWRSHFETGSLGVVKAGRTLRKEDTPAVEVPVLQVLHRVVCGLEGIGRGVQRDFALGVEGHQLRQVVVGTHQVADEVELGRDDVYGRDVEVLAVADNVVAPG